jgi:hypothetical protein
MWSSYRYTVHVSFLPILFKVPLPGVFPQMSTNHRNNSRSSIPEHVAAEITSRNVSFPYHFLLNDRNDNAVAVGTRIDKEPVGENSSTRSLHEEVISYATTVGSAESHSNNNYASILITLRLLKKKQCHCTDSTLLP